MSFMVNSTKLYGRIIETLQSLSEGRGRGNTSNRTYEASITPMPRPDKDI
jgi:hypothetical protein